jgi:nucleoside-diphosphate-sugar epimerase
LKKNFSVLVTGSCGFIGKNLLERLFFKNILTIGTYFRRKNFIKSSKIKYIKIDTSNYENFNNKELNPDVIVHLSNKVLTASMLKRNKLVNFVDSLKSILNILNFCNIKKTKKLIYISSSTGYPSSKNKLKENDYFSNDLPIEHYLVGSISRILEKIIFIYKNIFNLKTEIIILRPSAIYGRNDNFRIRSARLIPYLIKKIISAKSIILIPGSGSLVRNWVNVSEFVNLIIKLIFTKKKRDILVMNVSSDKNFSTLQITKKILKILNKKKIQIKKRIIFEKKLNHRILDNDKMKKLGFSVDNKSIDYYLKETIHWYKNSL